MSGFTIKVSAGSGGKSDKVTAAAVVTGGIGNEVTGTPPSDGVKTDLQGANIEVEGPSGDAEYKDVKVLGIVEGGIENKLVQQDSGASGVASTGERYKMSAKPRGICCIFNNKKFEGREMRSGTDKDKGDMARVFEKLNFKVKPFTDSEADVMETRLKKLSKEDHSNHDCLVVIFLTHGKDGAVQGTDNEWLDVNTITSYFKTASCPTLANKPKLFFFQSCRGRVYQKGVKLQSDDGDEDETVQGKTVEELVAPEADFFFGYSTVPGTKSLRNVEMGSWYIQALAETFEEHAKSKDLLSMMTIVKRRVNDRKFECDDGSYITQTAEMTSRLLKDLYF